jgi:hypothetical protein
VPSTLLQRLLCSNVLLTPGCALQYRLERSCWHNIIFVDQLNELPFDGIYVKFGNFDWETQHSVAYTVPLKQFVPLVFANVLYCVLSKGVKAYTVSWARVSVYLVLQFFEKCGPR